MRPARGRVLDNPVPVYALEVRQEMFRGKRGLVPALWHLEIANGLAMAERRRDLSAADAEDALDQILLMAASKVDTQGIWFLRAMRTPTRGPFS